MMKALLGIRFRALFATLTAQSAKKSKPQGKKGMILLYVILYTYVLVVVGGVMCFTFSSLSKVYHATGLDWLYFSTAGLMGLALSLLGGVFTTQNQLYNAKDNDLLLSMPIKPGIILLSRILPLFALNLLFVSIVMIPAIVMYAINVHMSVIGIALQVLTMFGICLFSQAIACILGWLLHLLLQKLNKSAASFIFMILFLGIYFYVYSQASNILKMLAVNGQKIADTLQSWAWPLYALGKGCLVSIPHFLSFGAIGTILFLLVYLFLSATFLSAATASSKSKRRRKVTADAYRASSPAGTLTRKEWKKFLGSPIYLTNMGLGVVLTAIVPIAAIIFRKDLQMIALLTDHLGITPLIICAILSFTISTSCISTPSVSLEGKNIWILKSMPISGKNILRAKLLFHNLMTVPISMISGLMVALVLGCNIADCILVMLIPGLLALTNGLLGLWAGLKWAKLDFINEAYPCKQSVAVLVGMFGMMGLSILLGVGYWALYDYISATGYMALIALLLGGICYGFYRLNMTWGVRKWDSL